MSKPRPGLTWGKVAEAIYTSPAYRLEIAMALIGIMHEALTEIAAGRDDRARNIASAALAKVKGKL